MRKKTNTPPTDEEILSYDSVPPEVAAAYIGWSSSTLYQALQQERAPFGFSVCRENSTSHTYNISPGLLVNYKRGMLPTYRLTEVQAIAVDGMTRLFNARMEALTDNLRKSVML